MLLMDWVHVIWDAGSCYMGRELKYCLAGIALCPLPGARRSRFFQPAVETPMRGDIKN